MWKNGLVAEGLEAEGLEAEGLEAWAFLEAGDFLVAGVRWESLLTGGTNFDLTSLFSEDIGVYAGFGKSKSSSESAMLNLKN